MKKTILTVALGLLMLPVCHSQNSSPKADKNNFFTWWKNEVNEKRNKAVALAVLHAFGSGDIDFIMKNIASDGVDYGEGSNPPVIGKDSIKASLTMWLSSLENYKATNARAIAEGDYVYVYADWSGTFKVDFLGLPTQGKSFAYKDVDIFKFNKKGKITEHRAIQSLTGIFAQVLSQSAEAPVSLVR
ncbi:ester cyclase [Foetidibacter luteolus]|uniref:ester cyclase n=1 Tax=Foetidibacter luteolus TaxID=2608880 RepID=UPI00129ADC7D|nr:ester cyclase [Foetidibacter luteolus]